MTSISGSREPVVSMAAEDVAFWKIVSAGAAGNRAETGHSFAIYDHLDGDVLELRMTDRDRKAVGDPLLL